MSGEASRRFACFGGKASVHVRGNDREAAEEGVENARQRLLEAHRRLTRFDPDSELCRLNRDPRATVPASPLLRLLARAVLEAGELSGGLVDATVIDSLEQAGYRESMAGAGSDGRWETPERFAPPKAAGPDPGARWRLVRADEGAGTVVRPPGLRIDSGGIAKGLLADAVGATFDNEPAYAVDCCGDVRVGGTAARPRRVRIADPFGGETVGELAIADGGVATSGIGRRSWTGPDGRPAHHLIDPASGEPARTGIVQATALAPSAFLAEVYAKAALLSGPGTAERWLPHGGALVFEDGSSKVLDNAPAAARVAA
jgi:thiamine biosynthesis lipoprotein